MDPPFFYAWEHNEWFIVDYLKAHGAKFEYLFIKSHVRKQAALENGDQH